MNRRLFLPALPLLLLLSCTRAVAQDEPRPEPRGDAASREAGRGERTSGEGGPLDRLHVYEVGPGNAAGAADTARAFVDVTGTGEVTAEPDVVRVIFAVETLRPTAREAGSENAERMNAVFGALRGSGIRGLEIETFGYGLQPNYRRPRPNESENRPLEIESYRATNNIRVSARDVAAAGALIDAAIGAGANRVAGLHFEIADPEPLRLEALRLAVERARQEARTIAEALGVPLGPPLEVRGGADFPMPRQDVMYRAMEAAAATPVEGGEQRITATVTIRYRLGGSGR